MDSNFSQWLSLLCYDAQIFDWREPIEGGLWVLFLKFTSSLLSDMSFCRLIFTFLPLVLNFSKVVRFLLVGNGIQTPRSGL